MFNSGPLGGSVINGSSAAGADSLLANFVEQGAGAFTLTVPVALGATFQARGGATFDLTDIDRISATFSEESGFSSTLSWKVVVFETTMSTHTAFCAGINVPVRVSTGMARMIQNPSHGKVVS